MADFAVQEINKGNTSTAAYQLLDVLSAETQLVSGTNYDLILKLAHGDAEEIHKVLVYSQPWTETLELVNDEVLP